MEKNRNVDIRERLGVKETLMQKVHQIQHTWLDHVWRMNNERIAKFAREGKVKGKRRVGKPKISWLPTALRRRGLNLVEAAIETANNGSDWKGL